LFGLIAHVPLMTVAGLLVFFAGGVSRVWSRFALRRVTYERQFASERAFQGEEIEFTLRLTNAKPMPLPWIEVSDQFPEQLTPVDVHLAPAAAPGYVQFRRSTSLAWYERVTWRYRLRCGHRGYYRIGPAILRSGDLFGIFSRGVEVPDTAAITVYPRFLDLGDLGLPAQRPFGDERGSRPQFVDPTRIRGLRGYRPGDSLRRIDWKATARRATLLSRQFDPAATHQVLVALNAATMEHDWQGYDPAVLERAVSVAATVVRDALASRFAAGLVTNGSFPGYDRPIVIRPGRSPDQLPRILEGLAAVQPLTLQELDTSLAAAASRIPVGSTVVVVAGLLPERLLTMLLRLRGAGHRVQVLWVGDGPLPEVPDVLDAVDLGGQLRRLERGQTPDARGVAPPAGVRGERVAATVDLVGEDGEAQWRRPRT
jgi:uncharacterized protein (DUF58 family)